MLGPVRFLKGPIMFIITPPHQPLEDFYITMPELPSHTAVMQTVAANSPDSNGERRNAPVWALVCLFLGLALLVVSGAFLIIVEVMK
jgi:hypothetical protein